MQIKKPVRRALEVLLATVALCGPQALYTGIGVYNNSRYDAEFRKERTVYLERQLPLNLPENQRVSIQRELDSLRALR